MGERFYGDETRGTHDGRQHQGAWRGSHRADHSHYEQWGKEADEGDRAEAHYHALIRHHRSTSYAKSALWRLGWAAYRAGDNEVAIGLFDELRARESDGLGDLRPRYWRARALERLGREEAISEFATIARRYPLSYYGWRAKSRAVASDPFERETEAVVTVGDLQGTTALTPRDLARPEALLARPQNGLHPNSYEFGYGN